jgi:hypothetical protein
LLPLLRGRRLRRLLPLLLWWLLPLLLRRLLPLLLWWLRLGCRLLSLG